MRATLNGLMAVESVSPKALDWESLGRIVQSTARQAVRSRRMADVSDIEAARAENVGLGEECSR